jgi:hypothetical protein
MTIFPTQCFNLDNTGQIGSQHVTLFANSHDSGKFPKHSRFYKAGFLYGLQPLYEK